MIKNIAIGFGVLATLLISGCSTDSNVDKFEESKAREAEAAGNAKEIADSKSGNAWDTVTDGHPIDAYHGYFEASHEQAGYEAEAEKERTYQKGLVQQ